MTTRYPSWGKAKIECGDTCGWRGFETSLRKVPLDARGFAHQNVCPKCGCDSYVFVKAAKPLVLPLKAHYFDQIASGVKKVEYRLATEYWAKRLEGRTFSKIVLTKGYPPAADTSRRMERAWRGAVRKVITHPHFGDTPVEVFEIDVE